MDLPDFPSSTRPSTTSTTSTTSSVSWDVPMPAAGRVASASAALGMARSLPRPISSTAARRAGGASSSRDDRESGDDFVPPHLLACSMVEPQGHHMFGESLSTAKGAAALRLRSSTLRRTGYMDGRLGGAAAPVRMPSS